MFIATLSSLVLLASGGQTTLSSDSVVKQRTIHLSDYDLSDERDVRRLRDRIDASLLNVCPYFAIYMEGEDQQSCLDQARTAAYAQLDQHIQHAQAHQRLAQN
ncbi:UrcA family protein [Woodsholea maritima]|uniref:UrcA family protein n=1 Tax=Woodsholea maritima TaxID=240237 RepID=UPI00036D7463|nr:UrcA family protein [Woodsholea maritima]